ncbi:putative pectinesterase [Helianthus annuus]|nr:putative pectinesterase [Helianthus annuus]
MALEGGKKKKYTVIAIATMLVVAAVVGTIFHVRRSTKEIEIHTEEKTGAVILLAATVVTATTIIILCKYTDFRDICRETLERIKAGIKAPSQLIKASFAHAVERIQFAIDKSSTIRQSEKDPRAVVALDQCKELLGVSIDDLKRSINKVSLFDVPKLKDNTIELRVWLSGSVTYQETCIDAFDNTTSNSGPAMVKLLDLGIKLTRNSLAMLDGIIELAGGKPPISKIFVPRVPQEPEPTTTVIDIDNNQPELPQPEVPQTKPKGFIFDWRINRKGPQPEVPQPNPKTINVDIDQNIPQPNPKTINVDIDQNIPQPNPKTINVDIDQNVPQPKSKTKTINVDVQGNVPQPKPKTKTINVDIQGNVPQPKPKTKTINVDIQGNVPQPKPKTKTINVDIQGNVPQPKPRTTVWKKEVTIVHSHGTKPVEVTGRRMLDQTPIDDQEPESQSENEPIMLHETDTPYPTWADTSRRSLINADPGTLKPNAVVAQDGSGQFKTIMEAVNTAPKRSPQPFIILIKAGVYKEYVTIPRGIDNVVFLGEGPTKTKITGNKNYIDGVATFHSATVAVNGDGFMARGVGFENTAGPDKHQAVALRVSADMSIFHNCVMEGYQDTLYTHSYRQFYRQCSISGTIDFIFGNAAAVFQDCKMIVRKPMSNQACMVTAQGRKDQHSVGGLVFDGCTITAEPDFLSAAPMPKSYLGRPWKEFSRTIIMQSFIDKNIDPEGWAPWVGTFGQDTCYYAEFNNKGPGADTSRRVKWKGVKKISQQEAASFGPGTYIQGDTWIKASSVPYDAGLMRI